MRAKPAPDPGAPAGWLAAFHQDIVSHANDVADLQPTLLMPVQALVDLGLAPQRVSFSLLTRHPSLSGLGYVWTRTSGAVTSFERPAHFLDTPAHLTSPLHEVLTRSAPLFVDVAAMTQDPRFDILQQFASDGATRYFALPVRSASNGVHVLALTTHCAGGWHGADTHTVACVGPVVGLMILSGPTKEGDEYVGSQILDPDNGKVYRSKVRLTDNGKTLSVRGYIGVPMLGRAQTWVRQE